MPKYMMIWEGDLSRQPVDFNERGLSYKQALAMVKADIESGLLKEFGKLNGPLKGFWIAEGSEIEIGLMMEKYLPYFTFPEVYNVFTYEQCIEITDKMIE